MLHIAEEEEDDVEVFEAKEARAVPWPQKDSKRIQDYIRDGFWSRKNNSS